MSINVGSLEMKSHSFLPLSTLLSNNTLKLKVDSYTTTTSVAKNLALKIHFVYKCTLGDCS